MERLRIAVMGAGSVGCYVGAHLTRTCHVTLIARPTVLDAIGDGLTVTDLPGRTTTVAPPELALSTEASAVMGADVVLLTTKSADTSAATAQIAPFLHGDAIVVSLQNGLRGARLIDAALSAAHPSKATRPLVLSGMVPFNVIRTAPDHWKQATSGELIVKDHPRVDPLVKAMRGAGLAIGVHPDMRAVLYAKLLLNLNNPINALSGDPLATELRDRDHRWVLAACQDEALAVAKEAAIQPARLTALPASRMPALLRSPTPVFSTLARTQLTISPDARSSMSDDLALGRPTEIAELQGLVVDLGETYGVPTPVCRAVRDLIRQAEAEGHERRPLSGRALRAAVTI